MNSKQLGRHGAIRVGTRGGVGAILTLAFSSALAACTISDPILDHDRVGVGGTTGVGGRQSGTGGNPNFGVGGRQSGTGGADFGAGGRQSGTGGLEDLGVGGRQSGTGGADFGVGGRQSGTGGADFGVGGAPGIGGSGSGGNGVGGAPGNDCDQQLTLFDCNARPDCHAVFFDPGSCTCSSLGCCAQFHHCAGGFTAICTGLITCAVLPPHCESPYLISYRDGCYEGCVHYRDCPP
jgi:hypothetical protein